MALPRAVETRDTITAEDVSASVIRAFSRAQRFEKPFVHWLLSDVLPPEAARAVYALPIAAPAIGDTLGKRETHNSSRIFFSKSNQERFPVAAAIARALQDPQTVAAIRKTTGAALEGTSLRIELAKDRNGFWLEPHRDVGPKMFTMQLYLNEGPGSEAFGTDLFTSDAPHSHCGRAPSGFNQAFLFLPSENTWHGFQPRPISGVRTSLIVNYVDDSWRSRHELAFPDQPV